jgi:hypothetical protein
VKFLRPKGELSLHGCDFLGGTAVRNQFRNR